MSAHTEAPTDAAVDAQLDAILRASGSALRHYSMHKTISDMRAALRSAVAALSPPDPSAAPVVPQGWKLVPEEPTPQMLAAYWDEALEVCMLDHFANATRANGILAKAYAAMLRAAPPAPQQGEQG